MTLYTTFLISLIVLLMMIELNHLLKPKSPLSIGNKGWKSHVNNEGVLTITGILTISNNDKRMEVMVPEMSIATKLIGETVGNDYNVEIDLRPEYDKGSIRNDGYWEAFIVKSSSLSKVQVKITISPKYIQDKILNLSCIWLSIDWINYGPFGRLKRRDCFVVPIKKPKPATLQDAKIFKHELYEVIPIKTHILGPSDNLVDVINYYASGLLQAGDIITIGETPLAVMQKRYVHPLNIQVSSLARILCRPFHPTSSLATACGMQTLIDISGPSRVIFAWFLAMLSKPLGIRGIFYRIAGEQARLIDDITGTTPPYDQCIVLGPTSTKEICERTANTLGVSVAIVDVNDLGKVKVLAASKDCERKLLLRSLVSNPAGNANEQTPLVLVRPRTRTPQNCNF